MNIVMETWQKSLDTLTVAGAEQQKLMQTWMDEGRIGREQGIKMMDELADAAIKNQAELQKFVEATVKMSLAALQIPTAQQVADLTRQVEELTAQFASMRK